MYNLTEVNLIISVVVIVIYTGVSIKFIATFMWATKNLPSFLHSKLW